MVTVYEWCKRNRKIRKLNKVWSHKNIANPKEVSFYTNEKYYFVCENNHEWLSKPKIYFYNSKCPYCSHRIASREYNLEVVCPEISKEWNEKLNNNVLPNQVLPHIANKYWWKCKNGHEWQASINSRSRGSGCPYCAHQLPSKEYNLKVICPITMKQWDYKRNGDLLPEQLLPNSITKVWWICENGHSYKSSPNVRMRSGCPYCAHQLPSKDYNLKVIYPEAVKYWDYERNKLNPEDYLPHSEKKVWWICHFNKNHRFKSAICNRVSNKNGCSYCKRELGTSFPEQTIYFYLNKLYSDCRNRVKIENREFDIFIPKINLIIEYDGILYHSNEKQIQNDKIKDSILIKNNISFIRVKEVKNLEKKVVIKDNIIFCKVDSNYLYLNDVVKCVINYINDKYNENFCVDVDIYRDNSEINNHYLSLRRKNSLVKRKPLLLKEWDYEKNKDINPECISPYSRVRLWWKCSNGHSWSATASNRMTNHNCPYCSNQKIDESNCFAFYYPQYVKCWDKTKNGEITPYNVSKKSGKIVWWKCNNGHSWNKMIKEFVKHPNCPYCKKKNQ